MLMQIEYLGHSAVSVRTKLGKRLLFDPWITGNPVCPKNLVDVGRSDYVFVSHDHSDHGLKDAIELCQRDNATLITNYEVGEYAQERGVENVELCNPGGAFSVSDMRVSATPAIHSSGMGIPVGFLVEVEGESVWFMGDTGYCAEFDYLCKKHATDLVFMPIGARFTLGIPEAIDVCKLLGKATVVPIHYNTFPSIAADPEQFKRQAEAETYVQVQVMSAGQLVDL